MPVHMADMPTGSACPQAAMLHVAHFGGMPIRQRLAFLPSKACQIQEVQDCIVEADIERVPSAVVLSGLLQRHSGARCAGDHPSGTRSLYTAPHFDHLYIVLICLKEEGMQLARAPGRRR